MQVVRRHHAVFLSLAGIALASAAAVARSGEAAPGYAIDVPDASRAQPTWTLDVSGEWPTECPPTLEKVKVEGADLRIDARSVLGLCTRRPSAFSIEVNPAAATEQSALAAGVYHVSFYAADGAQAPAKLRAFALVDRSDAAAPTIAPETGFWWTSETDALATNRSVFSIEMQNGQLSVALLGYDEAGRPEWYFGAASYSGRIAHVPLLRLEGGNSPFASAGGGGPRGEAALTLDLQFTSAAHAAAWLSRFAGSDDDAVLQLRSFELVRLPLAQVADGSAWRGDWVFVNDGAATPQKLHFDSVHALDATSFELDDAASGALVVCLRDAAHQETPPVSCALRLPNQAESIRFGSVAMARMDGTRADGSAVHLLRVSP